MNVDTFTIPDLRDFSLLQSCRLILERFGIDAVSMHIYQRFGRAAASIFREEALKEDYE